MTYLWQTGIRSNFDLWISCQILSVRPSVRPSKLPKSLQVPMDGRTDSVLVRCHLYSTTLPAMYLKIENVARRISCVYYAYSPKKFEIYVHFYRKTTSLHLQMTNN